MISASWQMPLNASTLNIQGQAIFPSGRALPVYPGVRQLSVSLPYIEVSGFDWGGNCALDGDRPGKRVRPIE